MEAWRCFVQAGNLQIEFQACACTASPVRRSSPSRGNLYLSGTMKLYPGPDKNSSSDSFDWLIALVWIPATDMHRSTGEPMLTMVLMG